MTDQQRAYRAMERLTEDLQKPAVVIVVAGDESHVQINDPTSERLEDLKLIGQKSLYALSLYLQRIDHAIEIAARAGEVHH